MFGHSECNRDKNLPSKICNFQNVFLAHYAIMLRLCFNLVVLKWFKLYRSLATLSATEIKIFQVKYENFQNVFLAHYAIMLRLCFNLVVLKWFKLYRCLATLSALKIKIFQVKYAVFKMYFWHIVH